MAASVQLQFDDICNSVAFSPHGDTLLAVGLSDKAFALCDPVSGSILTLQGRTANCVAFSPCGRLLASSSWENTVRLWDLITKECVIKLEGHTSWLSCIAFSPDGSLLASASSDLTIRLWNVATRSLNKVLQGHIFWVSGVAFSSCGRLLASSSYDRTVRLWNMPEGTPGPVFRHDDGWFFCVAFSTLANTNLLAAGSSDRTVRLWDVSGALNGGGGAKLVRTLKDHVSKVWSVAFSPDGSQLASGSDDCTVKLWSVTSGVMLKTLKGHSCSVASVAFDPNGHQLASASFDQTVRIWTVCEWSDRRHHHLFGPELKRIVFLLMCVKQRQETEKTNNFRLSMQLWLSVFQTLAKIIT